MPPNVLRSHRLGLQSAAQGVAHAKPRQRAGSEQGTERTGRPGRSSKGRAGKRLLSACSPFAQAEATSTKGEQAERKPKSATWLTRATWGTCARVPPARSPRSCEAAAHEHGAFLLSSRCCRHTPAACPLCAVPCSPVAWPRRRGQKHVHVYTLVLVTTPSTSSETIATGDTDYPYHSPRPLTRGGEHLQGPSRSRGHGDQVALVAMS